MNLSQFKLERLITYVISVETRKAYNLRIDHIQSHMHDVRQYMYVTLPAPTPTLITEWFLLGKLQQQHLQVVDCERVAWVAHSSTLL